MTTVAVFRTGGTGFGYDPPGPVVPGGHTRGQTRGAPPKSTTPAPVVTGGHPKMTITAEGATPFVVPYAPGSTSFDALVPEFSTTPRGGRAPLLLQAGEPLRTVSFELVLGKFDPNSAIETELKALEQIAESGARLKVSLDRRTNARLWRMTGLSIEVVGRQHGTNAATRARASVTLTQAADVVVAVGPVSGGAKSKAPKKRPKSYVVKKGDTLQSIAKRFYGDTKAWRRIADANKIKKPKAQLKVGRKLKLP